MRKHSGEKPFHCTICNKDFSRKEGLQYHMQSHERQAQKICLSLQNPNIRSFIHDPNSSSANDLIQQPYPENPYDKNSETCHEPSTNDCENYAFFPSELNSDIIKTEDDVCEQKCITL